MDRVNRAIVPSNRFVDVRLSLGIRRPSFGQLMKWFTLSVALEVFVAAGHCGFVLGASPGKDRVMHQGLAHHIGRP